MNSFRLKISKKSIINLFSITGLFILISVPSLKILYSSSMINILALLLLLFAVTLQKIFYLSILKKKLLFFWSIFSMVWFLNFYNEFHFYSLKEFIEYIYFIVVVYLVILLSTYDVFSKVTFLVFLWGVFLAIWQLLFGIKLSLELGQHYLTLSMAMGAAMAYSFRFIFAVNDVLIKRIFFFFGFFLILLSLATLLSRSVFVLNGIIIFVLLFAYIIISNEITLMKKVFTLSFLIIISLLITVYFIEFIDFKQAYRFEQLLDNLESEPRAISYIRDIRLVSDNIIFGYGINSYEHIVKEVYPHNIFLEILFFGGIFLFVPFMVIIYIYFKIVYKSLKYNFTNINLLSGLSVSLFYFMQYNLSFALNTSYIAITSIVLFLVGFSDLNKKYSDHQQ